jgi:hypothetical protein
MNPREGRSVSERPLPDFYQVVSENYVRLQEVKIR